MEKNEIAIVAKETGVNDKTAQSLKKSFGPFLDQLSDWEEKAFKLQVKDENDLESMERAREARLVLKKIRVEADKVRKALKEESNRYNNAVQSTYKIIEAAIVPMEAHLKQQEDFIRLAREKRQAELQEARIQALEGLEEFAPMNIDFGVLSEEDFNRLLNAAKLAKKDAEERAAEQARLEVERKAKERLANDRRQMIGGAWSYFQDIDRIGDMTKEEFEAELKSANAKLDEFLKSREEAEKKAKEAAAAEQAAQKKAEAERKAREEAERKLREKEEAEAKAKAEEERLAKEAEKATDRDKLRRIAGTITELAKNVSEAKFKTKIGRKTADDVVVLLGKINSFINEKTSK